MFLTVVVVAGWLLALYDLAFSPPQVLLTPSLGKMRRCAEGPAGCRFSSALSVVAVRKDLTCRGVTALEADAVISLR